MRLGAARLVLATALLLAPAALDAVQVQMNIFQGKRVARGAFPAVVGLTYGNARAPQCTGTLIAPDVVLTAGHCVCAQVETGRRMRNAFVGDDALDLAPATRGHFFPVTATKAAYDCSRPDDPLRTDVGVVLLDRRVAGAPPVPFAAEGRIDSAIGFRIVGFGATDRGGASFDYVKREAAVPPIAVPCRKEDVEEFGCQPGKEIVSGKMGSADTCRGDSGGPLLVSPDGDEGAPSASGFALAGVTSASVINAGTMCGGGGIYVKLTPAVIAWVGANAAALRRRAAS